MFRLNRREFIQASTASLLMNSVTGSVSSGNLAEVKETAKGVQVKGKNYTWEWLQTDDQFRLLDRQGLLMTSGILQPAVIVQPGTDRRGRESTAGKPTPHPEGWQVHRQLRRCQRQRETDGHLAVRGGSSMAGPGCL